MAARDAGARRNVRLTERVALSPENPTSEYLDLPLNEFLELVASGAQLLAEARWPPAVALAAGLAGMGPPVRRSTGRCSRVGRPCGCLEAEGRTSGKDRRGSLRARARRSSPPARADLRPA